jgi:thiol:disulfide interchange protein
MAQTDDRSANAMPKLLIIATVALLALRLVTSAIAIASPSPASRHIAWHSPAEQSQLPSAQGKPVIYQFYAQWSDPCKRMDETSLANNQIREMIEGEFVPVRITDLSHEKGKNPQWITDLEKRYRIFALPTLVIVDSRGEPMGSLIGNCSSLTTYRFLTRAIHQHKPATKTVYRG